MPSRIGIDIGGTFTDVVVLNEATGAVSHDKALTTPHELTQAVLACLDQVGADLGDTSFVIHGTTIGINAIVEHKGAKTALMTTEGFRDVLEIGRANFLRMYDVLYQRPSLLVPRRLRLEVPERITATGEIHEPLVESALPALVDALKSEQVDSVAISFLFSYLNPIHEKAVADLLRRALPGTAITVSHQITQEWREYERTSTTVINAMIQPIMERYLGALYGVLAARGFDGRLLITQSNGGTFSVDAARRKPVHTMESGPAAGVVACAALCRDVGEDRLISFDMGGTTAKCAIVDRGEPAIAEEYHVDGHPIRIPVLDIKEVSAGGGSIAWIDSGGAMCLGPRSAGAEPGPVCYGRGGAEPTVTDANLALGRINPESFLGGHMPLDLDGANRAIATLADRLRLDPARAAAGILRLADVKTALAVRSITTSRGLDPRDYTLVAYGGCGPLHAAAIARELAIPRLLIPPSPSTFSAWGMLAADLRHDLVRTVLEHLDRTHADWAEARFAEMAVEIESAFPAIAGSRLRRGVDLRYLGQEHTVTVGLDILSDWPDLRSRFDTAHERVYGYSAPTVEVELLNLRLTAVLEIEKPHLQALEKRRTGTAEFDARDVYSMKQGSPTGFRIFRREDLRAGDSFEGPAAIEETSTTTIVEPGDRLSVDDYGCLRIEIQF